MGTFSFGKICEFCYSSWIRGSPVDHCMPLLLQQWRPFQTFPFLLDDFLCWLQGAVLVLIISLETSSVLVSLLLSLCSLFPESPFNFITPVIISRRQPLNCHPLQPICRLDIKLNKADQSSLPPNLQVWPSASPDLWNQMWMPSWKIPLSLIATLIEFDRNFLCSENSQLGTMELCETLGKADYVAFIRFSKSS